MATALSKTRNDGGLRVTCLSEQTIAIIRNVSAQYVRINPLRTGNPLKGTMRACISDSLDFLYGKLQRVK